MKKKYLIVVAHPDDETLGCGALISKLREKKNFIKILFLGEGTSCRFDELTDIKVIKKEINKREKFCRNALKKLKVNDFKFFNLPCGKFDQIPVLNIAKIIEHEIKKFKPNVIITHSLNDVHVDHKTCYQACLQASRPSNKNLVEEFYSFEIPSATDKNFDKPFKPNYFIEISKKNLKNKIDALKCYKTEIAKHPFSRSTDLIKNLAMVRGAQCGRFYAEAFKIVRKISKI